MKIEKEKMINDLKKIKIYEKLGFIKVDFVESKRYIILILHINKVPDLDIELYNFALHEHLLVSLHPEIVKLKFFHKLIGIDIIPELENKIVIKLFFLK